jgi:hypothetical protein
LLSVIPDGTRQIRSLQSHRDQVNPQRFRFRTRQLLVLLQQILQFQFGMANAQVQFGLAEPCHHVLFSDDVIGTHAYLGHDAGAAGNDIIDGAASDQNARPIDGSGNGTKDAPGQCGQDHRRGGEQGEPASRQGNLHQMIQLLRGGKTFQRDFAKDMAFLRHGLGPPPGQKIRPNERSSRARGLQLVPGRGGEGAAGYGSELLIHARLRVAG